MMRGLASLAMAAIFVPTTALAQPATRRVFVDAVATSGGVLLDLKATDFQISEGGEPREVSSATLVRRPARIVLIVDATEAIRQPIGQIRTALATFLEAIDVQHEMMFVTVAGTPQVSVRPTTDRAPMIKAANVLFGTSGASQMHRTIDDIFHRFGQTTDHRPVFVVVTAEGFESTENINPQEIKHVGDHFIARGGTLHAVRLNVPMRGTTYRGGNLTEMPVTLMVARDTGGAFTDTSANGLLEVLQRLADVINDAHESAGMVYQLEYAGQPAKGRKPVAPVVRINREGVELKVFSAP
jgi:hypothetical protein